MANLAISAFDGDEVDERVVLDSAALEKIVDADIAEYDEYFQAELHNDPLTKGEKATIKTYLHYHLVRKHQAPREPSTV